MINIEVFQWLAKLKKKQWLIFLPCLRLVMSNIEQKPITRALVNPSFQEISDYFGYDSTKYVPEIAALLQQWTDQGHVEVYQTIQDREYGMIKSSELNSKGVLAPYYIGLYHARLVEGEHDPLVVVKFYEDEIQYHTESATEAVDMRFMIDHEDFFGTASVKRDP
ncbi:hypothetical protein EAY22_22475, partial [Vibrio anguillarum]|nr:hypothetical protein [Vibrio anguillarum]